MWCRWRTTIVCVCAWDKLAQDSMLLLCGGFLLWIVPGACVREETERKRDRAVWMELFLSLFPGCRFTPNAITKRCRDRPSSVTALNNTGKLLPYLPTNSSATLPICSFFLSDSLSDYLCLSFYLSLSLLRTHTFSLSLI